MTKTQKGSAYKPRIGVEDRRRSLVDAAMRVMRRGGIKAATTRAICAEAGVPQGLFHYCFASKRDLYVAVLASEADLDTAREWPAIGAGLRPEEAVRGFLIAYWEQVEADPEAQLVLFELASLVQRDPDLQYAARTEHATYEKVLAFGEQLEREAGFEFVEDRRAIADLVMATLEGMVAAWLGHRDDHRARTALTLFASLLATMTRPVGAAR